MVKVWDIRGGYTTHTFHGHSGVISALHFFQIAHSLPPEVTPKKRQKSRDREDSEDHERPSSQSNAGLRLASGGEDGNVRVWNLHKRSPAAVLASHSSVVRKLDYSPEENAILSACRDKTAIVWDVQTWKVRRTITALESLESAGFAANGKVIFTGGESGRLRIWSLSGAELTAEQPAKSETEAILDVLHFQNLPYLISVQADQTVLCHSLTNLDKVSTISAIAPLPITRQISGSYDEIIDLAFVGEHHRHLALATNVEDIRIVAVGTSDGSTNGPQFGSDVATLKGHEDIIICMDVDWSGHWLATGAKDNAARLWKIYPATGEYECYATFTGHAESLGAIALPRLVPAADSSAYQNPLQHPPAYLVTGSQDKTVKRWEIPAISQERRLGKALYTRKAHEKDINALDTNDRGTLFASASQDRTVKIWNVQEGEVQGVLRGHKRGVWAVRFAPSGTSGIISGAGQVSSNRGLVLTGSGDKTVRVWSLADYSCLLTLEGHTNSVLKVVWLPQSKRAQQEHRAAQVASAAGDGLVKVWDLGTGEAECTLDNHTDRVWALAVQPSEDNSVADEMAVDAASSSKEDDDDNDEADTDFEDDDDEQIILATDQPTTLVSGGGDGVLTFWADTTRSAILETRQRESQRVEQNQQLSNLIFEKDYRSAITLALQLDQPGRLLSLFTAIIEDKEDEIPGEESITGRKDVDTVIASLSDSQIYKLLLRVRDWNTNARTADVAQRILHVLIKRYPADRLASIRVPDLGATKGKTISLLEMYHGIRAYTDRHLRRIDELLEQSYLLDFTLGEMDEVTANSTEQTSEAGEVNGVNGFHNRSADLMLVDSS